jgi:hypothetical protein
MHIVGRGCRTLPVVVWALLSIAHVGHATEQERPNILIAISDDQSYPHASAYGCRFIETPAFDRLRMRSRLHRGAVRRGRRC